MNHKNRILGTLVVATLQLAASAALAQQQVVADQCPIVGTATTATGALPVAAGPLNPVDGFPEYVTDINGVSVQRCLDPAVCFFDPIVPTDPLSLQIGSGGEAFYWDASTVLTDSAGNRLLTVVMAAETAFLQGGPNGEPVNGSQFPFLRLRFVLNAPLNAQGVPVDGTYTVKHPYGTEVFTVVGATGARDVFHTVDKGLSPGQTMTGPVGPFLIATTRPNGFLGDANGLPTTVTGSPCGRNFVELSGVDSLGNPIDFGGQTFVVRSEEFTVQGQLYDGRVQTPLAPTRMTYSRAADGTGQLETFAESTATALVTADDGPTTPVANQQYRGVTALDSASIPSGLGIESLVLPVADAAQLPPVVQLRATDPRAATATDATALNLGMVDFVDLKSAEYDANTKTLTVVARSGDRLGNPQLSLRGFGNFAAGSDTMVVANLDAPPATVAVDSAAGGSDSAPVMIKITATLGAPTAILMDAAASTSRTLTLSWTDNANSESGFRVYVTPAGGAQVLAGSYGANTTSAVIGGLEPGTSYTLVVEAHTASAAAASEPVPASTLALPLAPASVAAALSATQRQINVTWTASPDPDVTGYAVYRSDAAGSPLAGAANLSRTTTSFVDTTAPLGASLTYQVVALRLRAGVTDASAPAETLALVTPVAPVAASALGGTIAGLSIDLGWTGSDNADQYQVYRQTDGGAFVAVGGRLAGSATTFADTGLTGGSYVYRVDAINWAGTTQSVVSAPIRLANLVAPTVVSASAAAAPVVTWTDNSGGESGQRIRRRTYTVSATDGSTTVSDWTTLATSAAIAGLGSRGSYTDASAVAGTAYMYEVAALDGATAGPAATTGVTIATAGGLPRMTGFSTITPAVVNNLGRVTLTWAASTLPAVGGYEITRCNAVLVFGLPTAFCSNTPVKVGTATNSGGSVDGRNTVSFVDTTVARNTSYVYNIRLVGGAGTGLSGPTLLAGRTARVL